MSLIKMDPYETYQKYLALRTHFKSDSYDYFQYHGKLKGDRTKFETRKDKFHFYKISKMRHPVDYMVANMVANPNFWSGDVNDEQSMSIYNNWVKRRDTLSYLISKEVEHMNDSYDTNIIVQDEQHPRLLVLYIRKVISAETIIVLNKLTGFFSYWNKVLGDDIVWPDEYKKLKKYEPFFINSVDLDRIKSIIRDRFE